MLVRLNVWNTFAYAVRFPIPAASQQLFVVLRELDRTGVAEIWVETPPKTSDWAGVRDWLERAAA